MRALRAVLDFSRTLLRMPAPWLVWIGLMAMANAMVPLAFLETVEAKATLGAVALGMIVQISIFSARGFVRLLGLGHMPWLVLVPWLLTRLNGADPGTAVRYWMLSVIVINTVSLIIDVTDVVRYARGERSPLLTLN